MNYSYILFDVDNTLIDFKASFMNAAKKVLALGGHSTDDASAEAYFEFNDDTWFGFELDRIDSEYICKNYHRLYHKYLLTSNERAARQMHLKASPQELTDCFVRELGALAVPNPNAIEICRLLSKTHTICVATNGLVHVQPGKLTKFEGMFRHVFISEAMDCIKPEKEYFRYILNKLGCDSSECLMVGDSLPNDIGGANSSGIASCYYNPSGLINTTGIIPTYEIKDFNELLKIV